MPWLPFPFGPQPQSQQSSALPIQLPQIPQIPQIPVTPPPDHQSFSSLASMANMGHPPPLSPQLLKSFTQEVYGAGASLAGVNYLNGMNNMNNLNMNMNMNMMGLQHMQMPGMGISGMGSLKPSSLQAMNARAMQGTVAAGVAKQQRRRENKSPDANAQTATPATAPSTTTSAASAATQSTQSTQSTNKTADTAETAPTEQTQTEPPKASQPPHKPTDKETKDTIPHISSLGDGFSSASSSLNNADPRYIAMASRIAAYYHQRCQAVANFQQQRCQAWANMQRQKSQEMSQAAMLVVAWYIRDRIHRRRRRQKRQFRRGLSQSASVSPARITKGEAVRKWVLQVPEGAAANETGPKPSDPSEVSFDMDRDAASDKDARLYSVADNLIKSQLARIDVPMLGAISFGSETESEASDEPDNEEKDDDAYEVAYEETPARAGLGAGATFTTPVKDAMNKEEEYSSSSESDEYEDEEDYCMESSEVVQHGTAGTRQTSSF